MLVSTKGRYALRVMIDLAEHNDDTFIPLKDVAARQEISEKYLESIISVLSKARLVMGMRGKGGGYKLTKAPKDYTVGSILKLADGSLAPIACLEIPENQCQRSSYCKTLPMWSRLNQRIDDFFEAISLEDLVRGTLPPGV